jgi:hypothetical protein
VVELLWFCFAGMKYGGKVKKKKLMFYSILIGCSVK